MPKPLRLSGLFHPDHYSLRIAGHELAIICAFAAREASGNGLNAARIQSVQQHRIEHQPDNAPVTVKERVNPEQASYLLAAHLRHTYACTRRVVAGRGADSHV